MEKRILGIVLSALGIVGLICAGVFFINSGTDSKSIKTILFCAVLGAIFFFSGIGLIKNTNDKV